MLVRVLSEEYTHTYIHTYIAMKTCVGPSSQPRRVTHTHRHIYIHTYTHTAMRTCVGPSSQRGIHTYIHTYIAMKTCVGPSSRPRRVIFPEKEDLNLVQVKKITGICRYDLVYMHACMRVCVYGVCSYIYIYIYIYIDIVCVYIYIYI